MNEFNPIPSASPDDMMPSVESAIPPVQSPAPAQPDVTPSTIDSTQRIDDHQPKQPAMSDYSQNKPPMGGYPQNQPPMGGYPQNQPPMGGYPQNQPPMGGYPQNQPPMGGYPQNQPPMGGYPQNQPPMGGYPQNQPPMSGFPQNQPPMGGYPQNQPPMGGYPQSQPPMGGYPQNQPPMGGYPQNQPPMGAYPQNQATIGGYQPYGSLPYERRIPREEHQAKPTPFDSNEYYKPEKHYTEADSLSNEPEKQISVKGMVIAIVAMVLVVLVVAFGLFFAGKYDFLSSIGVDTRPEITLPVYNKPEAEENLVDENGKYTVVGIAQYVAPAIVELYVYDAESSDAPIGSGSGIVISTDGYIVTNAHVVEGASEISVTLSDERTFSAQVVGRDVKSDIAVIKISAGNLTAAVFGDSDEITLGEQVIALGSPAGLTGSMSLGIVSGIHRELRMNEGNGMLLNCIQTDAAISPGNSGGALVNMYGQVVGIVSLKYVDEKYDNIGFAIEINEAIPYIEELLNNGFIAGRFRIGITYTSCPPELAAITDDGITGIVVEGISEDCDISNTELQVGDVITKMNGIEVYDRSTVEEAVSLCREGVQSTAEVTRINADGTLSTFTIEFLPMPDTSGEY